MQTDVHISTAIRRIRFSELAKTTTEADLRGLLTRFGPIRSYLRPLDPKTNRPGEVVFVEMADPGATRAAAALGGQALRDRPLAVSVQVLHSTRGRFAAPEQSDTPIPA